MREKKKALRAAVRAAAGSPSVEGWRTEPDGVVEIIEALPEFASARTVALYHALPDELPTAEMLRRWHGRKRLALPVIRDSEITFREYTGPGDIAPGPFGIGEPATGREIPPREIDLMLVPGVAFDAAGRRLGRGGGYYDRYLSRPEAAHIYKVGLCRPGALVPEVPAEAHDIPMDVVITN